MPLAWVDHAAARTATPLPDLASTRIQLRLPPEPEPERGPERELELASIPNGAAPHGMSVELVHVSRPESGSWSRGKKQCDLWEFVWGASLMLADLLATVAHREGTGLQGVRTLELGCGAGLGSLAAALGGANVLATDGVEDAVRLVALSAERNGVAPRLGGGARGSGSAAELPSRGVVEVGVLDWFQRESVPKSEFQLVIGSDILLFLFGLSSFWF